MTAPTESIVARGHPSKSKAFSLTADFNGYIGNLDGLRVLLGFKASGTPATFADLTHSSTWKMVDADRGSFLFHKDDVDQWFSGIWTSNALLITGLSGESVGLHFFVALCTGDPESTTALEAVSAPIPLRA